jgi:hypothetical protein
VNKFYVAFCARHVALPTRRASRVKTICRCDEFLHTYLSMKMEQTECSETSAYKIQMPGNYPEESTRYSEHGASLKSRLRKFPHNPALQLQNSKLCASFQLVSLSAQSNNTLLITLLPSLHKTLFCLQPAYVCQVRSLRLESFREADFINYFLQRMHCLLKHKIL